MKMLLWFTLQLGLAQGAALPAAEALDPIPQHLASLQLGGLARRQGQGAPINIDLSVWRRGQTELQWYGDITVSTPPVTL
jgi:hypothetical protein